MRGADDFWRDFGKDQNGKGDGQRSGAQRPLFFAEHLDGDHADQGCGSGIDQVVAEQDDTQHLVRAPQQVKCFLCPVMAGLGQVAQAETAGGHHRRLAERKKS